MQVSGILTLGLASVAIGLFFGHVVILVELKMQLELRKECTNKSPRRLR